MVIQEGRDSGWTLCEPGCCEFDGLVATETGVRLWAALVWKEIRRDEMRMLDEVVPYACKKTLEDDGVAIRIEAEAVDRSRVGWNAEVAWLFVAWLWLWSDRADFDDTEA